MDIAKLSPDLRSALELDSATNAFEVMVLVSPDAPEHDLTKVFGHHPRRGRRLMGASLDRTAIGGLTEQPWVETVSLMGYVHPLEG